MLQIGRRVTFDFAAVNIAHFPIEGKTDAAVKVPREGSIGQKRRYDAIRDVVAKRLAAVFCCGTKCIIALKVMLVRQCTDFLVRHLEVGQMGEAL